MVEILGIDPGASGCAVHMDQDHNFEECRFAKPNRPPHWPTVAKWLKTDTVNIQAYLEFVQAMPGDGKSTMFQFGKNAGIIEGILYTCEIPFELVVPQTWRRAFGLGGRKYPGTKSQQRSARKRDHLEKARETFPGVKLTQETCDAYLIAEYGWRLTFGSKEAAPDRQLRQGTGIIRVSQE